MLKESQKQIIERLWKNERIGLTIYWANIAKAWNMKMEELVAMLIELDERAIP